ncbi:MAG: phosphoenolpyruvate--protein phosphotransferase, partial [Acetobacteraceae bacterium]|nr:phosphoenolpyruvate--protein phosphotransferase [Acetobacteraceae bacterium]
MFRTVEQPAQITRNKIHAEDIPAETARFEAAILQSRRQLLKLRSRLSVLPEESQGEIAPLIDAYLQMLGQSRLLRGARQRIQERLLSAETAVMEEANAVAAALMALEDAEGTGHAGAGPARQADEVREI